MSLPSGPTRPACNLGRRTPSREPLPRESMYAAKWIIGGSHLEVDANLN